MHIEVTVGQVPRHLVCKHPDKISAFHLWLLQSHHILCEQKHRLLSQSKKQMLQSMLIISMSRSDSLNTNLTAIRRIKQALKNEHMFMGSRTYVPPLYEHMLFGPRTYVHENAVPHAKQLMIARPLVAWLVQELMFKDRGRFCDPLSLRVYWTSAVA